MTSGILGVGFYISPDDPFLMQAGFPWTWLAPILLALRYGLGPAFLSVSLMLACFIYFQLGSGTAIDLYKFYFLGGLITTLLCGEFSTQWQNQVRRAEQYRQYTQERLENLSKTYCVTRISHDRLEQALISRPATLRSALEELRLLIKEYQGVLEPQAGTRLLEILAQYCSLEQAGLYVLAKPQQLGFSAKFKQFLGGGNVHQQKTAQYTETSESKAGKLSFNTDPLAHIGVQFALAIDDTLLQYCLEDGQTHYQAVNKLIPGCSSEYLAMVPLFIRPQQLSGLLVIKKMPFLSLNHEVMQILTILVNYYAYQLQAQQDAREIINVYPDCPVEFAAEFLRLLRLHTDTQVDSSIVAIYIRPHPQQKDIIAQLRRQIRGLDYFWQTQRDDKEILISLLPLAGEATLDGFTLRMKNLVKSFFNLSFEQADSPLTIHGLLLSGTEPCALLENLVAPVTQEDIAYAI
jgi:hypothetical protein